MNDRGENGLFVVSDEALAVAVPIAKDATKQITMTSRIRFTDSPPL
jgi:hypothetical protein